MTTAYIRDQCCHLQANEVPLGACFVYLQFGSSMFFKFGCFLAVRASSNLSKASGHTSKKDQCEFLQ